MPSCLQACLTTGWTCHRDHPLQIQMQNRDTIDSSSSPCMLVSSRTAHHALTKSWRNKFSKYKTHGDSQRTFVPDCLWSGGLFSTFPGHFLVSFLGLGPLWVNLVSALNLTGIRTSILAYFWITFPIYWRCNFEFVSVFCNCLSAPSVETAPVSCTAAFSLF